jgi:hypothetical protein
MALAVADLAHATWTQPVARSASPAPTSSPAPPQLETRLLPVVPRADVSATGHLGLIEVGGQILGRYGYLAVGGFGHAFMKRPLLGGSYFVGGGLAGLAVRRPLGVRFELLGLVGAFQRQSGSYDPEASPHTTYPGDPGVDTTIPCAGGRTRVSGLVGRRRVHFEWGAQFSYYRDLTKGRVTYQFEAHDIQDRSLGVVERRLQTGGRNTFQIVLTLGLTVDLF